MSERKTFLLRLNASDLEALRRWADDDFRSLNGQIEFILRQALKSQRGYEARGRRPDRSSGGGSG
jgi:hypothetical protein